MARQSRCGAAVVATALVLAVAGCAEEAVRGADGEVTEGGQVGVYALTVGDCIEETREGSVEAVEVVPCTQEHAQEVYHEFEVPEQAWPGEDDVSVAADEGCFRAFRSFVGIDFGESELDFVYLLPTEESWAGGDRLVQCLVQDPSGPVTGSLRGAER